HTLKNLLHLLPRYVSRKRFLISLYHAARFILFVEQKIAHRNVVGNHRVLIKDTDPYPLPDNNRPFVGGKLSRQDTQQGGLSDTIHPHESVLFTFYDAK